MMPDKRSTRRSAPRKTAPAGAKDSLIDRFETINRIQAALRSTLQVEDIRSIILATLISREGFDFSRQCSLNTFRPRGCCAA